MRALSAVAVQAARETNSDQVWLFLLEITHPNLTTPIYLVNNNEDIVSNSITYLRFPFSITLGQDIDTALPIVSLSIDNVSKLLIDTLRNSIQAPTLVLKLVLASQPDIVEITLSDLTLRNVTVTLQTVTGDLASEALLDTRHPADSISLSGGYYGLFRN